MMRGWRMGIEGWRDCFRSRGRCHCGSQGFVLRGLFLQSVSTCLLSSLRYPGGISTRVVPLRGRAKEAERS